MKKHISKFLSSYFFFYAVTYTGSALTAVSSFLMVEKLVGSIEGIAIALALKTAFMAIISPMIAKGLARFPLRYGFWASQLSGPLLLVPLFLGIRFNSPTLFLVGITIGGLPGLILGIAGTTYLRLISKNEIGEFRANQGRLQLVIGLCFVASAALAPLMLKYFSFETVLLLDVVSYIAGNIFIFALRKSLNKWDSPVSEGTAISNGNKAASSFNLTAFFIGFSIMMAYLLKGLPPMLAGHGELTSLLNLDPTARQSLWAFEAFAAVAAGLLYKRFHQKFEDLGLFELGLISSLWLLPILVFQNFICIAVATFFLSLSMTLTFMKLRDDFLARFHSKEETLWATGYVNLVMNLTLTVSPIIIGALVSGFGASTSIAFVIGFQSTAFFVIRFFSPTYKESANLSKRIHGIGSRAILSFLLICCIVLTLLLHGFEKTRAEQQINVWILSVTRSVIPQLIDSDYVPIYSKLKLLKQTDLFTDFTIYDSQKKMIATLNEPKTVSLNLLPINDEAGSTWGYYSYSANKQYWWSFLYLVLPTIVLAIIAIGYLARNLFFRRIDAEISKIEKFIFSIEEQADLVASSDDALVTSLQISKEGFNELDRIGTVVLKLASKINERQKRIFDQKLLLAQNQKVAELAKMVAHDIRSPLSALNIAITGLTSYDPQRISLIAAAIQRINDIANDLLLKSRVVNPSSPRELAPVHLPEVIEALVSEKRTQYRSTNNITIVSDIGNSFSLFAKVNRAELARTISNLINNAVEAIASESGRVTISLACTQGFATITVDDDGAGISPEILPQIGQPGFSHGKRGTDSGNGLGLSKAIEFAKEMGGSLTIKSTLGSGTKVQLNLPTIPCAEWFAESIPVNKNQKVFSLDDEPTMTRLWESRFTLEDNLKATHRGFNDVREFISVCTDQAFFNGEKPLYLIDYNLNSKEFTGLDLVRQFHDSGDWILVTSHADDPVIQNECSILKIKLLPKSLADRIPIRPLP